MTAEWARGFWALRLAGPSGVCGLTDPGELARLSADELRLLLLDAARARDLFAEQVAAAEAEVARRAGPATEK